MTAPLVKRLPNRPLQRTRSSTQPQTRSARGSLTKRLALIKEKAGKHPEWPPSQLILARLLFGANQGVPGRRALEQAAAFAPITRMCT